jgi:hypothetical protein
MQLVKSMKDLLKKVRYHEDGLPETVVGISSALGVKLTKSDGKEHDYGIVSRRCVTTAFTAYLCSSFVNSTTMGLDKFLYHAPGSGTTAESTNDTTLATAVGLRQAGTNTSALNVFTSVATSTFTAGGSINEHGIFSSSASGTLLDRSTFATISVASADTITWTYQLTCTAGG